MKPSQNPQIAALIERFLDGTTSLEEERTLAQYFQTEEVPQEWLALKEMFAWFDAGMPETEPQTKPVPLRIAWRRWIAAACVVAVLFGGAMLWWKAQETPSTELPEVAQTVPTVAKVSVAPMAKAEPTMSPVAATPQKVMHHKPLAAETNVVSPQVQQATLAPIPAEPQLSPEDAAQLLAENEALRREIAEAHAEIEKIKMQALRARLESNGYYETSLEDGTKIYQPIEEQPKFIAL